MRLNPLALASFAFAVLAGPLGAQANLSEPLEDPVVQLSRPADRARVVTRMGEIEGTRRQNARHRAMLLGLPLRSERPGGRVEEIADFDGDRPIYLTTHNANAAISTGANLLRVSPYSLTGSGVTIGLWDEGSALSTHQEFGGRVVVMDGAVASAHSTHVGGTLIASGVDALAHGMAGAGTVNSYDWTNDMSEMTSRGATYAGEAGRIYLSNHSYGYVSGWNNVGGGSPYRQWEWNGTGTSATSADTNFGLYNAQARTSDLLAYSAPYYLMFRSAGNDGVDNPVAGQSIALSAGSGTVATYNFAIHPAGDGAYRGGFETVGFDEVAKDVITIGSTADAVSGGIRNTGNAILSPFSSCGPTDDGRIKPDVVANGDALYSSLNSSTTSYAYYSGTSMASPSATGSAALLIQEYGNLFPGQAMRASTLKGLLIHTADDRGNAGPDYKYGWGLINVQAAADLISDHFAFPVKQRIAENQLTTSTITCTHSFNWDGVSSISATLCWTDPAGSALTAADSRSARLVNNLNLKIIAPNGTEFFPYVMPFVGTWTQASMDLPATTGVNNTDNVEQVRIAAPPASGIYQVVVSFSGTLTNASQYYSLLVSGSTEQPPSPPAAPINVEATPGNNMITLTWTAASGATGYHVKRSLTSGGPYATIGSASGTSYSDPSVTNGSTYYYTVSATNAGGEGVDSGEVSAVPAGMPSLIAATSSSGSSGAYGSSVTFTATVTGGGGTATGTVAFFEGATLLATGTLNGSGQASVATNSLAMGSHSITATYSGDAVYFASTSAAFGYAVMAKPVNITGVAAANKVYDGTTGVSLSGGSVSGLVSGDSVTVVAGNGAFDSANAGSRSVITTGYALGGANAGNYSLAAQPTANATITPRPLQLTGSRSYDGTVVAGAGVFSIQNNLDGANLALTGSMDLVGKGVGMQSVITAAAVAQVQSATGNSGSSRSTSFGVSMASAPVKGNTMVAVISTTGNGLNSVSSITETGATWVRASQAANATGTTTEIWYASNVASAGTSITISQSSIRSAAVVMEFSGILTANSVDQVANSTGSGAAASTGMTATTNQADELWIGGVGLNNSSITLGSVLNSFTAVTNAQSTNSTANKNARIYALRRIVSAAGAASSGGTLSTLTPWSGAIATFKSAAQGSLTLTGSAAGNYTMSGASGSVQITPKVLAVGGLSASDRFYDGTVAVNFTSSATLFSPEAPGTGSNGDGRSYTGDTVTLQGTAVGAFADKHAELAKPVTVTGLALAGAQAGNYSLSAPTDLSAKIAALPMTVTAVAESKTYDGTTAASGIPSLSPPLLAGDSASVLSQWFQDPSAGNGNKGIVPGITIVDGNGGANYVVTLMNNNTGTILPAEAGVVLHNLNQSHDGSPRATTATTTPPGLPVSITYGGLSIAPTQIGQYAVVATVSDANYVGSGTGTLVIAAPTGWLTWCNEHFTAAEQAAGLAAENADPDFDNWRNLAEYALGTDPRQFNLPPVATKDADSLSLIFTRPANLQDVTYAAESSENLSIWSPVPLELMQTGDTETLRARVLINLGNPLLRFLRLRFVRP